MGIVRRLVIAGLASATLVTTATATPFSQLVVFGDSLSDAGNAYAMTETPLIAGYPRFPPSPPYATTFSNGPTAAQYLATRLGVTTVLGWPASGAASNNFAVGGARNGSGNYNVEINNPPGLGAAYPALAQTGIEQQLKRYSAQHPAVPNAESTLFLLWGGPNDMFLGLETRPPQDIATVIKDAVTDLANDILALAGLGARNILIPGMPDLGKTPEGLSKGELISGYMSMASAGYNLGLDTAIDDLSDLLSPIGVRLYEFDTTAYLAGVTADPSDYGLDNVTQSCLYDGGLAALAGGCAGYLYFDKVHPTTATHP